MPRTFGGFVGPLSMYSQGMNTSDIEGHIRDIYEQQISDSAISWIMDKILVVSGSGWGEDGVRWGYEVAGRMPLRSQISATGTLSKNQYIVKRGQIWPHRLSQRSE